MAPLKGELAKLRERVERLHKLDLANEAIIAELRNDLEGMTRDRDEAVRRENAIDEAARNLLSAFGLGPNSTSGCVELQALADAVFA
jgi:chromosome segregation ATPase